MFKSKPRSRDEEWERDGQLFGLKVFGLLLCAMAFGGGLGYLLPLLI